ncbi:MAG: hypothetical protein WDN47_03840 [Candidatus Doudnabacteria bacterium]
MTIWLEPSAFLNFTDSAMVFTDCSHASRASLYSQTLIAQQSLMSRKSDGSGIGGRLMLIGKFMFM